MINRFALLCALRAGRYTSYLDLRSEGPRHQLASTASVTRWRSPCVSAIFHAAAASLSITLLLAGCQSMTLDKIRSMTSADLANAKAKATLADDRSAILCWDRLVPVVSPQGATTGVASGIEDTRIIAMAIAGDCSGILGPVISLVGGL